MEYLSVVLNFVAPPPLSPIFQPGGQLAGWNEDLVFVSGFLILLGALDLLIVRPFLNPKGRYFALHLVANTIAAVAAFPDFKRGMTADPITVFSGPSHTMVANSVICAIHLYHCIAFNLRWDDIFHHLTFASILCGLAIPFKHIGGVANNFGCFFLSGVPGGIDYFMLVCVYQGLMKKATQKKYYSLINIYLRGPSMVVYTFLGWQCIYNGTYGPPLPMVLIVIFLHFFNGQYYTRQAVATTTLYFYKQKLIKEGILPADSRDEDGEGAKKKPVPTAASPARKKPSRKED